MSVAAHLKIQIDEYDARIRTFVPYYEEMLSEAAKSLRLLVEHSPKIIDIGIGTGALAAQCLDIHHDAHIFGFDNDPAMMEIAKGRLANYDNVNLLTADFQKSAFPLCDAIVASIALHHIRTPEEKQAFYAKCRAVLKPGGLLVSADCFPAKEEHLASIHRRSWLAHLERTYSASEAESFLDAWSNEDRYFPLDDELEWLHKSGFIPEVHWRRDSFAVILGIR